MKKMFLVMGFCLAYQAASATELYRWSDSGGKVHYGDRPEADAERLKISMPAAEAASAVDEASLPYEARLAHKNFPVTLYVSEKCGDICNKARDFLRQRKVPFTDTVLTTQEDFDAFKKKTGFDNVPVLLVGRTWLGGFESAKWQEELDVAGYPK